MVQTKEERAAYLKALYEKNKVKIAAQHKAYYEKNKVKIAAQRKVNREKNKVKIAARAKVRSEKNKEKKDAIAKNHYENNKEMIDAYNEAKKIKQIADAKAYQKTWHKINKEEKAKKEKIYNQTPKRKRSSTISHWKRKGVLGDIDSFYDERYFPATTCEVCEKKFKSNYDKHMDHCHTTGEIRYVLCCSCNSHDYWKKVLERKNNNSNIIYEPTKFHSDLQIQL